MSPTIIHSLADFPFVKCRGLEASVMELIASSGELRPKTPKGFMLLALVFLFKRKIFPLAGNRRLSLVQSSS